MNIQSASSGVIKCQKIFKLLPQEKIYKGSNTVFNEALTAFSEELYLRNEIALFKAKLSNQRER